MAEEKTTTTETTQTEVNPAIDEAKIAELIKQNAANAVKEALAGFQQQPPTTSVVTEEPGYFENLIDSRTQGKLANLGLMAESANDKAEFYSSDFWLEEVDEYLTSDDPKEMKAEKRELRDKVEKYFTNLVKQGKALERNEVALRVLGEYVKDNKSKYDEKVVKRSKNKENVELEKARAAVNIGASALVDFNAQDVHNMQEDKMMEKYSNLVF